MFGKDVDLIRKNLALYLVTDSRWAYDETLCEQVKKALQGGVTAVQYREKNLTEKNYLKTAFELKKLCRTYNVPFIINDSPLLAKEIDADGVHLGQQDTPIDEARIILGNDKIIGISVHNKEEAIIAQHNGADYIAVSAMFDSIVKTDNAIVKNEMLKKITQVAVIPVVAMGGINGGNLNLLANSEIDGVAVSTGILSKEDIKEATENMAFKLKGLL